MFARLNENPAMTLQDIKETKRYGCMDGWTDARTDNVKTVYPLQTKFAGGIMIRTDGRTDGWTDARTDNVKTVYPLQTKFAGGGGAIMISIIQEHECKILFIICRDLF